MFIINTAVPDSSAKIYIPTRIVLGCREPAERTCMALDEVGYDFEVNEVSNAPERSDNEKMRAEALMLLLFAPVGGNA